MSFNKLSNIYLKLFSSTYNMNTDLESEPPTKKGRFHFQGYNRYYIYYVIYVMKKCTIIKLVKTIVYIVVITV